MPPRVTGTRARSPMRPAGPVSRAISKASRAAVITPRTAERAGCVRGAEHCPATSRRRTRTRPRARTTRDRATGRARVTASSPPTIRVSGYGPSTSQPPPFGSAPQGRHGGDSPGFGGSPQPGYGAGSQRAVGPGRGDVDPLTAPGRFSSPPPGLPSGPQRPLGSVTQDPLSSGPQSAFSAGPRRVAGSLPPGPSASQAPQASPGLGRWSDQAPGHRARRARRAPTTGLRRRRGRHRGLPPVRGG